MEQKIVFWLITFLAGCLFAIVFYLYKKQETEIKCLKERNETQQLEIQHLNDKLWSEDKLGSTIENAVDKSLLRFENKMLKTGWLHSHEGKQEKTG